LVSENQLTPESLKRVHKLIGLEKIVINDLSPGAEMHYENGQTRKVKKIFNDEKWLHHRRKKAAGIFVDGRLIQLVDFVERGEFVYSIEDIIYRIKLTIR
jgi:hypothetical protein